MLSRRVSAAISVPIVVASFAIGTIAGIHTEEPVSTARPPIAKDLTAPPREVADAQPPAPVLPPPEAADGAQREEQREAGAATLPKSIAVEMPPAVSLPVESPSIEAAHTVPDPQFPVHVPTLASVVLPLGPPPELTRPTPPVAQQPRYYYPAPKRKPKQEVVETVPILGPLFSMFK